MSRGDTATSERRDTVQSTFGQRRCQAVWLLGHQELPGGIRSFGVDGILVNHELPVAARPIPRGIPLAGHLQPTYDAYAIAKIDGIPNVQEIRRQNGLPWSSAVPTNLYGRCRISADRFSDAACTHPALRRGSHISGHTTATNWGTGSPRRELSQSGDMADGCPSHAARALRRPRANRRGQRYRHRDTGDRRDDCVCRRSHRVGRHQTGRHPADVDRRFVIQLGGAVVEDQPERRFGSAVKWYKEHAGDLWSLYEQPGGKDANVQRYRDLGVGGEKTLKSGEDDEHCGSNT